MPPLLRPSSVAIAALALVLGALALRARRPGLAAWCFATAAWAMSLLLAGDPTTREWGERTLMIGFFVPAAFHHAAVEDRGWPRLPVAVLYAGAVLLAVLGALPGGLFLREGGTAQGPWFPFMFGTAFVVSTWPLYRLWRARSSAPEGERERLSYLLAAGFLGTFGGGVNVLQTLGAHRGTAGLGMVLLSLALLAWVVHAARLPTFGRFVEASLRYSVAAAALTTIYLGIVLVAVPGAGALDVDTTALLFLLVLVGQPVLFAARGGLAAWLVPGSGDVGGLTEALARSEARADHAERLAAVGTLASAVAHEVRNPLGVIAACATVLERQGANAETIAEIRGQVDRAARFAEDLLAYGRPAPLSPRAVDLAAVARLAIDERRTGLGLPTFPEVQVDGEGRVEGDWAQLGALVGVLVENAALAGARRVRVEVGAGPTEVKMVVEDDGPGVPDALRDRIFEPFVTGRSRDAARPGTGLGLAIARSTAERHQGRLSLVEPGDTVGTGALGGARFVLTLPVRRALPAGP